MTAILGIFHRDHSPVPNDLPGYLFAKETSCAIHGTNDWVRGSVGLGCQQFWSTPQDEGLVSPIHDENQCVIVASCRLDERAQLIAALKIESNEVNTWSDTQLILTAYAKWGTKTAEYLAGEFAFIIWDPRKDQVYLARDGLGTRSLCYYLDEQIFIIASVMDHILAHPAINRNINEGKIGDYLVGNYVSPSESLYQEISFLPPASAMTVDSKSSKSWQYWQIEPLKQIKYKRDEEYAEHYLELLQKVIREHLRTPGPVGISLSGGLDSTTLAALIVKNWDDLNIAQPSLISFSYDFQRFQGCNESEYIDPVVNQLKIESQRVPCDDCWTFNQFHDWSLDRGFILHDMYARLPDAVARAAQERGIRKLVSGFYGDVLFTGDGFWLAELLYVRQFRLAWQIMRNRWAEIDKQSELFELGLRQLIPYRWKRRYRRVRPRPVSNLHPGLHPEFIKRSRLMERMTQQNEPNSRPVPGMSQRINSLTMDAFAQGMAATRKHYLKRGMELDPIYWDRRLVEFSLALPADQHGRPGLDRWVVRNAMKSILPEPVRMRTEKTVFLPLMEYGLMERSVNLVRTLLSKPLIVQQDILQPAWLNREMESYFSGKGDGWLLWKAICLELWLKYIQP
jgi:asparagine synthase (glutamine-hydrolysing)